VKKCAVLHRESTQPEPGASAVGAGTPGMKQKSLLSLLPPHHEVAVLEGLDGEALERERGGPAASNPASSF